MMTFKGNPPAQLEGSGKEQSGLDQVCVALTSFNIRVPWPQRRS